MELIKYLMLGFAMIGCAGSVTEDVCPQPANWAGKSLVMVTSDYAVILIDKEGFSDNYCIYSGNVEVRPCAPKNHGYTCGNDEYSDTATLAFDSNGKLISCAGSDYCALMP